VPSAAAAPPGTDIASNALLKPLAGAWRTDENAPRKFWLEVQAGMILLHTTKVGLWTSSRTPIVSVENDKIMFQDAEKTIAMSFKLKQTALTISIPAPSVFQGQYELSRKSEEPD
jgi:hypothetical protein